METLVTILNFDDSGSGPEINSPRSLEACLRSGYDPKELFTKKKSFFKGRGVTEDMAEIKYDQFEKKRADKIENVVKEREAIIAYQEKYNKFGTKQSSFDNDDEANKNVDHMLELEAKRMENVRRRQEKELSKIVQKEQNMALLQAKIARAEEEERRKKKEHERKIHEQKLAADKKKAQRAQELARKEMEDQERRRELTKKEAAFERKKQKMEAEAAQQLLREAKEREKQREIKMEEHRQKTEALVHAQIALAEENRKKMQEREARVNAQLQQKKEAKKQEIIQNRAQAAKRIEEALVRHHELHEQKKEQFNKTQSEAIRRAKAHEVAEKEKLKLQADARDRKNRLRYNRLVDSYKGRTQHRQEIVTRRKEKDSIFSKQEQLRNEEHERRKFFNDLKKADKQENVERVARMNEFNRLQTMQAIAEADMRYERIQSQKEELMRRHREEAKASLTRKHAISNAMDLMRVTNDYTLLDQLFSDKKSKRKKNKGSGDDDGGDDRLNQTV
mmetsp:Transcript_11066/g.18078  ORF Transcript_11066/g.18078 Transcript_11066/m.18078 type:complete len:505 (-) Transcript_11066:241-1755(-)